MELFCLFISLSLITLVVWEISNNKNTNQKIIICLIFMVCILGEAGGYFGLCLLPCLTYFYKENYNSCFLICGIAIIPFNFGILFETKLSYFVYNVLLDSSLFIPHMLDFSSFLRPFLTFSLLLLFIFKTSKYRTVEFDEISKVR